MIVKHYAILFQVKMLIDEFGFNIESRCRYWCTISCNFCSATPLMVAVRQGHVKITHLLLQRHADILTTDEFGLTPLLIAVVKSSKTIIKMIISRSQHCCLINVCDSKGRTPLMYAAQDQPNMCRYLLKKGYKQLC